jgi:alpha-mannosidase
MVGAKKVELKIQDWSGSIGQWDTRVWNIPAERDWAISANHPVWPPADEAQREQRPIMPRYPEDYVGLKEGYVKTASLAWFASHHHTAAGLNQPYEYSYLFAYPIEVAAGARSITLPSNDKIRILAISTAQENPSISPVQPLYDKLGRTEPPQEMEAKSR